MDYYARDEILCVLIWLNYPILFTPVVFYSMQNNWLRIGNWVTGNLQKQGDD